MKGKPMTNPAYVVHYRCHLCGRMHLVIAQFLLPGGPTEPCTLAEHYPDGNFPPRIVDFLTDSLLWCDQANDYIERDDPARLHLTPRPPPPTSSSSSTACLESGKPRSEP